VIGEKMKIEVYLCDICGKRYERVAGSEYPTKLVLGSEVWKDICPECEQAIKKLIVEKRRENE